MIFVGKDFTTNNNNKKFLDNKKNTEKVTLKNTS